MKIIIIVACCLISSLHSMERTHPDTTHSAYERIYQKACGGDAWSLDRLSCLVDDDPVSHLGILKVLQQNEVRSYGDPFVRHKLLYLMGKLLAYLPTEEVYGIARHYFFKIIDEADEQVFACGLAGLRCLARVDIAIVCNILKECARNNNLQRRIDAIHCLEEIIYTETEGRNIMDTALAYMKDSEEQVLLAVIHFFTLFLESRSDSQCYASLIARHVIGGKYAVASPRLDQQILVLCIHLVRKVYHYSNIGMVLAQKQLCYDADDTVQCAALELFKTIIEGDDGRRHCSEICVAAQTFFEKHTHSVVVQYALFRLLTAIVHIYPQYEIRVQDMLQQLRF